MIAHDMLGLTKARFLLFRTHTYALFLVFIIFHSKSYSTFSEGTPPMSVGAARFHTVVPNSYLGCIGWTVSDLNVCNQGERFHSQSRPQLVQRSRARDECALHTVTAGRKHSSCLLKQQPMPGLEGK